MTVSTEEQSAFVTFGRTYIVRNDNGATLGGFTDESEARRCASIWDGRYRACGVDVGVEIYVQEPVMVSVDG